MRWESIDPLAERFLNSVPASWFSTMEPGNQESSTTGTGAVKAHDLADVASSRRDLEAPNQFMGALSQRVDDLENQVASLKAQLNQERGARQSSEVQAEAEKTMLMRTSDELLKRVHDLEKRMERRESRPVIVYSPGDRGKDSDHVRSHILEPHTPDDRTHPVRQYRPPATYNQRVVGLKPKASDEAIRPGRQSGETILHQHYQ
jgi:hypothetical protein